jgi:hypothetical protein
MAQYFSKAKSSSSVQVWRADLIALDAIERIVSPDTLIDRELHDPAHDTGGQIGHDFAASADFKDDFLRRLA